MKIKLDDEMSMRNPRLNHPDEIKEFFNQSFIQVGKLIDNAVVELLKRNGIRIEGDRELTFNDMVYVRHLGYTLDISTKEYKGNDKSITTYYDIKLMKDNESIDRESIEIKVSYDIEGINKYR